MVVVCVIACRTLCCEGSCAWSVRLSLRKYIMSEPTIPASCASLPTSYAGSATGLGSLLTGGSGERRWRTAETKGSPSDPIDSKLLFASVQYFRATSREPNWAAWLRRG